MFICQVGWRCALVLVDGFAAEEPAGDRHDLIGGPHGRRVGCQQRARRRSVRGRLLESRPARHGIGRPLRRWTGTSGSRRPLGKALGTVRRGRLHRCRRRRGIRRRSGRRRRRRRGSPSIAPSPRADVADRSELDRARPPGRRELAPRRRDHRRRGIAGDDAMAALRQRQGVFPGPAADLEQRGGRGEVAVDGAEHPRAHHRDQGIRRGGEEIIVA